MKFGWMIVCMATTFAFATTANGQLFPRRGVTRPGVICKIPNAEYQTAKHSKSVQAFSYRFVFLDDPADSVPNMSLGKGQTNINTVSTERQVSNAAAGRSAMTSTARKLGSDVAAEIAEVRMLAQQQFFDSEGGIRDLEAARNSIARAKQAARSKVNALNLESVTTIDVMSAIDAATLEAEEKLLLAATNLTGVEDQILKIKAERSLLEEKLGRLGKSFEIKSLIQPGNSVFDKSVEIFKTKTQNFDNAFGPGEQAVVRDHKLFQWKEDRLKIDHCEISQVAMRVDRDGTWALNLRADQNRRRTPPRYNPTLHLKRNQFSIALRCYGNMSGAVSNRSIGQPVFAEIKIGKFWVENGKPYFLVKSGHEGAIEENFDSIDRVEIEFFYDL